MSIGDTSRLGQLGRVRLRGRRQRLEFRVGAAAIICYLDKPMDRNGCAGRVTRPRRRQPEADTKLGARNRSGPVTEALRQNLIP